MSVKRSSSSFHQQNVKKKIKKEEKKYEADLYDFKHDIEISRQFFDDGSAIVYIENQERESKYYPPKPGNKYKILYDDIYGGEKSAARCISLTNDLDDAIEYISEIVRSVLGPGRYAFWVDSNKSGKNKYKYFGTDDYDEDEHSESFKEESDTEEDEESDSYTEEDDDESA